MKELIPDKELTFESLQKDPEIAVISDEVSTREELLETFARYLKLSRPNRRYSDYYSVKLFGCNVPNMFFNMSYRFKIDPPFPVNETFLVTEPDLYYNKQAFDEGKVNLCFVIGYSGSGKSHLTREYEGDGLEKVELDDLVCVKDHFTLNELKKMGDLLYSFFSGEGSKYYISRNERPVFANHAEVFVEFIKYAQEYAEEHKDKKFILEGIWTYLFFDDPSKFDKYAVFMKGTSLVKSKFRRMLRESENSISTSLDRFFDFGIYAADTTFRDINVDKWRRHFEKKKATVMKLEDNRYTLLAQNLMKRVNSINDFYVHGNAAGIKKIMKRTSENKRLDKTEKTIIAEECKRALADLK